VEGVGPITLKRIQAYFGDLASAWAANAIDLQAVEGIGSKLATAIAQQRPNLDLTPPAVPFLTPADEAYPALLFEIPDPPPVLYYQGQLELLPPVSDPACRPPLSVPAAPQTTVAAGPAASAPPSAAQA
jgi:DNA processing protein